jgi:hypothetical protein
VGGLRRRKKKTVGAIYGFHGLRTIEDLQSLLRRIDGGRCTAGYGVGLSVARPEPE